MVRLRDLIAPPPLVMCCLCFEPFSQDELEPVSDEPGKVWDVCKACAHHEKQHGASY